MKRARFRIVFLLGPVFPVLGQNPGAELRFESTALEVGESVDGQIVCTNIPQPDAPALKGPDGLDVSLVSSTPSTSSMLSIINGRREQVVTYIYPIRATARKAGRYVLGPFEITAGNQTFATNAVPFQVREPSKETAPDGDRFVFASIEVKPTSLYLTQSFEATLKLGIRKVMDRNGRYVEIDLLRNVVDLRSSELSVFAGGNARRSETSLRDSSGQTHRYEVFTVTQTIRADQPGDITVGPVFIKANYPTDLRATFFSNYEIVSSRKETARTEAIIVTVRKPPETGRPDSFNGAIGNYAMKVEARPERVEEGQPVTLTIRIGGAPLEGIAGPDLSRNAELFSRFEFTRDELSGDIENGVKVFRRAIFPRQAGEQTIPPILWSYFDTRTEQYVTLRSNPIPIIVDPSASPERGFARSGLNGGREEPTQLTVLTGGLAPSYENDETVLAQQAFTLTPAWVAGLAASPIVYCVMLLMSKRQARIRSDHRYLRRRRAESQALSRIRRAQAAPDEETRLVELAAAVRGYLVDRFDGPEGALTPADARQILLDRGADELLVDDVVRLLDAGDAARYAHATPGAGACNGDVSHVRELIRRMEQSIR